MKDVPLCRGYQFKTLDEALDFLKTQTDLNTVHIWPLEKYVKVSILHDSDMKRFMKREKGASE